MYVPFDNYITETSVSVKKLKYDIFSNNFFRSKKLKAFTLRLPRFSYILGPSP